MIALFKLGLCHGFKLHTLCLLQIAVPSRDRRPICVVPGAGRAYVERQTLIAKPSNAAHSIPKGHQTGRFTRAFTHELFSTYSLESNFEMIGKIFSWLMNDFIVNALAKNRKFQGMALRIDAFLTKNKETIANDVMKPGEKVVKENLSKVKESRMGMYYNAFVREMKVEFAEVNKAKLQSKK
jgi:hypothetical protein